MRWLKQCRHKWKTVGVTGVDVFSEWQDCRKDPPSKHITEFSLKCEKCGLPKIHRVRGTWTA